MKEIKEYLDYLAAVRRYSPLTVEKYSAVLEDFAGYACDAGDISKVLSFTMVRNWEAYLMDERKTAPATVRNYLSVLSSFCNYLVGRGVIPANPVRTVKRPKGERRLPVFYRKDAVLDYLERTRMYADGTIQSLYPDGLDKDAYESVLRRMIISLLYCTGLRRAELIGLDIGDVDFSRNVICVLGKGDKMREIPMISSLSEEISLYLDSVERMTGGKRSPEEPLLVTPKGGRLYPVYVDRAVKREFGEDGEFKGRKSPHVLRHTLATELLEGGTEINSIKELLGHSSLAATQIYTHNSAAQLKKIYQTAHPRAKKGGKYGD